MFANLWSQLVVLPLSGQKNKTKKQLLQVWKRRRGKGHWLSLKMRCDIDWDTLIFSLWYQYWFRAQSIFLLNIYQCSLLYSECMYIIIEYCLCNLSMQYGRYNVNSVCIDCILVLSCGQDIDFVSSVDYQSEFICNKVYSCWFTVTWMQCCLMCHLVTTLSPSPPSISIRV